MPSRAAIFSNRYSGKPSWNLAVARYASNEALACVPGSGCLGIGAVLTLHLLGQAYLHRLWSMT